MKALTLTQPWATLVATGNKKIETRSWNTLYRGKLAIHAAKGFPISVQGLCYDPVFKECLQFAGYKDHRALPTGAVIAVCNLVEVKKIIEYEKLPKGKELIFGNYQLGRYMWYLEDVVALPEPVPAKGALSLWEWNQ